MRLPCKDFFCSVEISWGKIGKDTTQVSIHEKDSLMFTAEIMFE